MDQSDGQGKGVIGSDYSEERTPAPLPPTGLSLSPSPCTGGVDHPLGEEGGASPQWAWKTLVDASAVNTQVLKQRHACLGTDVRFGPWALPHGPQTIRL